MIQDILPTPDLLTHLTAFKLDKGKTLKNTNSLYNTPKLTRCYNLIITIKSPTFLILK